MDGKIKIDGVRVYLDEENKIKRIGHEFNLVGEGIIREEGKFKWLEKTSRPYIDSVEANKWKDMQGFNNFTKVKGENGEMFGDILGEMQKCGEIASFKVKDVPQIVESKGTRTLDFIIVVEFSDEDICGICCRQRIIMKDGLLEKIDFSITNAKKMKEDEKGKLYVIESSGKTLEDVIKELGFENLRILQGVQTGEIIHGGKVFFGEEFKNSAEIETLKIVGNVELVLKGNRVFDWKQGEKIHCIIDTQKAYVDRYYTVEKQSGPIKYILKA